MDFTVKIPYRHQQVSFKVHVQKENLRSSTTDINRVLRRQENTTAVEKELEANRIRYYLFQ